MLPPGEWDPKIRIEPPQNIPSQEKRREKKPEKKDGGEGGAPGGEPHADDEEGALSLLRVA